MIAQHFSRQRSFLRNCHVARAAGCNHNLAPAGVRVRVGDGKARNGVIIDRDGLCDRLRRLRFQSGDENVFASAFTHGSRNADDLFGGLSRAVNHLGCTLAHAAVKIHLCIAQILKRLAFECGQRLFRGRIAVCNLTQQLQNLVFVVQNRRSPLISTRGAGSDRGQPRQSPHPVQR